MMCNVSLQEQASTIYRKRYDTRSGNQYKSDGQMTFVII